MAKKLKIKPPILPARKTDPTATDALERRAMAEFKRRMRSVALKYKAILDRVPSSPVVNARYTFELDAQMLSMLLEDASIIVDELLGADSEMSFWFWNEYVKPAYQKGASQAYANLSQQSAIYTAGRQSVEDILLSDAYQRRLILVRARVFEEMKNLSANVKADMARILTDGMARGKNPLEIAKNLTAQTGIESRRANRIARTEITGALRRARWDEADEAQEEYGIKTKLMHFSALSPTTRASHAERHSKLYTSDEVRDWYADAGNAVNCKCSQIEILVDKDGNPLDENIVKRTKDMVKK